MNSTARKSKMLFDRAFEDIAESNVSNRLNKVEANPKNKGRNSTPAPVYTLSSDERYTDEEYKTMMQKQRRHGISIRTTEIAKLKKCRDSL